MKNIRIVLTFILLLLGMQISLHAANDNLGEILYITSYNADTRYSNEFVGNLMADYAKKGGKHDIAIEAMNCYSLDSQNEWMPTLRNILKRHKNISFIVLYGPEALVSYMSLEDDEYKKIPVISVATQQYGATLECEAIKSVYNPEQTDVKSVDFMKIHDNFNIKGYYYYKYDIESDMQAIKTLFPDTKNVAVVSDFSYAGISMRNMVWGKLQKEFRSENIIMIDGSKMTMNDAIKAINNLPPHTVVLFCVWRYDSTGTIQMINGQQVFMKICMDKKLPTFSLTGSSFDPWAIASCHPTYDWYDGRVNPADIIYDILVNENDRPYYSYQDPNHMYYDKNMLDMFGIDETSLGENCTILNQKVITLYDIWENYQFTIICLIILIITMIIAFVAMAFYSMRMKKVRLILEKNASELEAARKEAVESNQMKTYFIQNMTHEIRTPLNAVVGFADVLCTPDLELNDEEVQMMGQQIRNNSNQLTMIINDILSISDIESGKYTVDLRKVDCMQNILLAMSAVERQVPNGVQMDFAPEMGDEMQIYTDAQRMQQIIVNMLTNACKNTKEGNITVSCKPDQEKNEMLITVTDTGKGVPPEDAERIFERFIKLDEFKPGAGLGLNICRTIVKRLEGRIWCDATYTGKGARFCLALPINPTN